MQNLNKKSNHSRWISCVPICYDRGMDDIDFFIEDTLLKKHHKRLEPEAQVSFMDKLLISHDVSAAQRLEEDTRYYHELLSKFVKTYGH